MSMVRYLFETGPQNGTVTNANSGSTASSLTGGSTCTFDTAMKAHGTYGAKFTCADGSQAYRRWPFAAPNTNWAMSVVITLPASAPGNTVNMARFAGADDTTRLALQVTNTGTLQLVDTGGAHNVTLATGLTWGAKYRVSLVATGGSTTASAVVAKVFGGSTAWTTQVGSTQNPTNLNLGTVSIAYVELGVTSNSTNAVVVGVDDVQLDDGGTTEIADYATPLATPVVSKGTTTHPTTIGGDDGAQVVTWPPVTDAVSYDAYLAAGTTPSQGDFLLVEAGVTSPYTFDGLGAGAYSFGIRARA